MIRKDNKKIETTTTTLPTLQKNRGYAPVYGQRSK